MTELTMAQKGKKIHEAVVKNIKEHGWHMFAIHGSESGEKPFFYTVGLTDLNLPELILVGGLQPTHAHAIFTTVIEEWKNNGYKQGIHDDFIQNREGKDLPMEIRTIEQTKLLKENYAVQLFNYYGKKDVAVAQLLWPDANGTLPTSPDFEMHELTEVFPPKLLSSFDA